MKFTTAEKNRAKRHVMRIVEPYLLQFGFAKANAQEFAVTIDCDNIGLLCIYLPPQMEYYRVHAAVGYGPTIISGPVSDPYGCSNSPNGKKYNFRLFGFSEETLTDVLITYQRGLKR